MGNFYYYKNERKKKNIIYYSERGILSYFTHCIDIPDILNKAINNSRNNLSEMIQEDSLVKYTVFGEFELGSQGFGCPDGAILIENNNNKTFIFIEAKMTEFNKSFKLPKKDLKGFNSSINGQIELKLRFINAFKAAKEKRSYLVSEQFINELSADYVNSDIFYKQGKPNPKNSKTKDWRRVKMDKDLKPLYNSLLDVDKFLFLIITADEKMPKEDLCKIRLCNTEKDKLYWLSLDDLIKTNQEFKLFK